MIRPRVKSPVSHDQALYLDELIEGHGGINDVVLPQFLGSIEELGTAALSGVLDLLEIGNGAGLLDQVLASAIILIFLKRKKLFCFIWC